MQSKRSKKGSKVTSITWELVPFDFEVVFSPGFLVFSYMTAVLAQQRFYRFKKR